ncbi:MAG TPA: outer membrane lipoprotein carrier protein LolA [Geobacteraceae bacterium]|nr:outer membrane lipoprotein carrier protein LolA [Geobacteraceae bacterium]
MRFPTLAFLMISLQLSVSPVSALQIPKYNVSLIDVINTVEKPFKPDRNGQTELSSVRADFFQRSTIAEKKKEYRADGQMYLKPASGSEPLKFRFDYFRPTRQEIVCDGRTLWVYLPENREVIQSDVSEFFDPSRHDISRDRALNFLQGLGRISKDFTIIFNSSMSDPAGNYILELTPRRASVTIEKLFITVNRESLIDRTGTRPQLNVPPAKNPESHLFPILSTTVVDHDGNSTTMEFSNIRANEMISDLTFKFDVPPEIQVVRPEGRRR